LNKSANSIHAAQLAELEKNLRIGISVEEFIRQIETEFLSDLTRNEEDIANFREWKGAYRNWKKEIIPIYYFLKHENGFVCLTYTNQQHPDFSLTNTNGEVFLIEVTTVFARADVESAKILNDKGYFVGDCLVRDNLPQSDFMNALTRARGGLLSKNVLACVEAIHNALNIKERKLNGVNYLVIYMPSVLTINENEFREQVLPEIECTSISCEQIYIVSENFSIGLKHEQ